jgi:hypothetical protein
VTAKKQLLSAAHTNVLQLHKIRVSEGLYELLGALAKLRRVTIGFVLSVRLSVSMEQLGSIGRIFIKSDVGGFFENLSRKFKIH